MSKKKFNDLQKFEIQNQNWFVLYIVHVLDREN